ncbi:MAG: hypothetical protein A2096_02585 [Spirochaetes bacterium GWF1_41_5]|nr:MAG: hypothetical protein A2096_02585 [Spirochaetes bacterium GWF1_41_5]
MKAAFYSGQAQFKIRQINPVSLENDSVLINVAYSGICGTDIHIYHGAMDKRVHIPQVIGHEMSGIIEKTGKNVSGFKKGDKVTVRPLDWCGACAACRAGLFHICYKLNFIGIDSPGSYQESWAVKERNVHKLPETISLRNAALIEPVAVACHDIRMAGLKENDFAVVLGGGPIGLLIALILKLKKINVILSEINSFRLSLAGKLGLTIINPQEENLETSINERTKAGGADAVFEATASQTAADIMPRLLKSRGKMILVGIYSKPLQLDTSRIFLRELSLHGVRVYEEEDFTEAIMLAAQNALPFNEIITRDFKLDEINDAFTYLDNSPNAMKILLQCS